MRQWGSHYVAGESFGGYCNFTATFDASFARAWGERVVLEYVVCCFLASQYKQIIDKHTDVYDVATAET